METSKTCPHFNFLYKNKKRKIKMWTLLSIVLCRVYPYTLSLFCLPRRVRLHLVQIQRYFLWGGGNLEKKPHLVKWLTFCSNRKIGGLGV